VNAEHQSIDPKAGVPEVGPAKSRAAWLRPQWIWIGLALALGAVAYRGLLAFHPTDSIVVEVEGWFFEPSDTAPVVVVALSLWLLYRRSDRLAALPWRGGSAVLSGLLFASALAIFVWSLCTRASDLQAVSLMLAGLGSAYLLGGRAALSVVWVPICFLLFAIPIPSPLRHAIVWKFQNGTAEATGTLLYTLGIPAVVSGDRMQLAKTTFAVIETCSGLRSVITLSMLAVLMIDLFRRGGWHAVLLLIFTPFLAFATNAARSVTLVLNPASEIAEIHSLQGIGMLLAAVLVLYAFDGLLERLHVPDGARTSAAPRSGAVPARSRSAWVFAFLVLLGILGRVVSPWREWSPNVPLPVDAIPRKLDDWRSSDLQTDRLFLGMAALTGMVDRRYAQGSTWVDVFVGSGSPRQRLRSFYSPKTAIPGSGWIIEEQTRRDLGGVPVDELVVRRGAERRLVRHWYLGTTGMLEETVREFLALDLSPFARPTRGVAVRLSTPIDSGATREEAAATLDAMADRLHEPLDSLMKPRETGSR